MVVFEVGLTHFPSSAVPKPQKKLEDEERGVVVVGLEVGGGVVVPFEVEDDAILVVVDGLHLPSAAVPYPHHCEIDEEVDEEMVEETDEAVVLLLIMGIARAEPARAATTKENEACIFVL